MNTIDASQDAPTSSPSTSAATSVTLGELENILGFHLRLANVAVFQDYQVTMAGLSLTPKQFAVLELIETNPGASQIDLAHCLRMDKASMMALVNKLEARHAIERRQSESDRRRQELFITTEGLALAKTAKKLRETHEARFKDRFSADELAELVSYLQRIYTSTSTTPLLEDEVD
ncbi:MarR family winged helix-turn-helix transcriptional regulator [Rhizobium oryziradicis]|uniref:MarR family winged helix-turn-helix transcriptional regulator n=1 Tax=Rhizobium oryziradicis TaxID=1867956 RepID=UPI0009FB2E98|nr:MarR family transcriptional regulator [Rhizobium oryziradicis]